MSNLIFYYYVDLNDVAISIAIFLRIRNEKFWINVNSVQMRKQQSCKSLTVCCKPVTLLMLLLSQFYVQLRQKRTPINNYFRSINVDADSICYSVDSFRRTKNQNGSNESFSRIFGGAKRIFYQISSEKNVQIVWGEMIFSRSTHATQIELPMKC